MTRCPHLVVSPCQAPPSHPAQPRPSWPAGPPWSSWGGGRPVEEEDTPRRASRRPRRPREPGEWEPPSHNQCFLAKQMLLLDDYMPTLMWMYEVDLMWSYWWGFLSLCYITLSAFCQMSDCLVLSWHYTFKHHSSLPYNFLTFLISPKALDKRKSILIRQPGSKYCFIQPPFAQ